MDNAQKAIMIGVGLFITIIIIGAVMMITGLGTDMLQQSQTKAEGISAALQEQLTSDYDQTEMTGANVLAAITRYRTDSLMFVGVYNTSSTNPATITFAAVPAGTSYAATKTFYAQLTYTAGRYTTASAPAQMTNQVTYGSFTQPTGSCYISTTATYRAYLVQSAGVTVGIVFVKK